VARIDEIPEPTRTAVLGLDCPAFPEQPFLAGPPLRERRVAIVSSAALHPREEAPFPAGTPEVRLLPASLPAGALVMSHISINFDRTGFQRDINTAYPIERLQALAVEGLIGGVAETHYAVMGSTDPRIMEATVDQIAGLLKQQQVDAVLLTPV
jgi:D-proline reductase (dithiol) PrdB